MDNEIYLNSFRRFGVEIELNSFDKRNFKTDPLRPGELPKGVYDIGIMVADNYPADKIMLKSWHPVHNNDFWIIKPDSSCGLELCTPVLRGGSGYNTVRNIISKIKEKYSDYVDNRCSFHVHIDVSDLNEQQISSVLSYWIKCEAVFMDIVPIHRKKNRYCMSVGTLDFIQHDTIIDPKFLIKKLGSQKYFSLNTFHYNRDNRKSIEFRIADHSYCIDPISATNWVKLLIHFVECSAKMPIPSPYTEGNVWSSYLWLNPKEVFHLLKFDEAISDELKEVKLWFLNKAKTNIISPEERGIWSERARKVSQVQFLELF